MSTELVGILIEKLAKIEAAIEQLIERKATKDFYSTDEVAEMLGRSGYTVREWCRKGQAEAVKAPNGRGWLIPHAELTRLRNEGPLPEVQIR